MFSICCSHRHKKTPHSSAHIENWQLQKYIWLRAIYLMPMRTGRLSKCTACRRAGKAFWFFSSGGDVKRLVAMTEGCRVSSCLKELISWYSLTKAKARNAIDVNGIGPSIFSGSKLEPGSRLQLVFHSFRADLWRSQPGPVRGDESLTQRFAGLRHWEFFCYEFAHAWPKTFSE